jgi:hypothetical protein
LLFPEQSFCFKSRAQVSRSGLEHRRDRDGFEPTLSGRTRPETRGSLISIYVALAPLLLLLGFLLGAVIWFKYVCTQELHIM